MDRIRYTVRWGDGDEDASRGRIALALSAGPDAWHCGSIADLAPREVMQLLQRPFADWSRLAYTDAGNDEARRVLGARWDDHISPRIAGCVNDAGNMAAEDGDYVSARDCDWQALYVSVRTGDDTECTLQITDVGGREGTWANILISPVAVAGDLAAAAEDAVRGLTEALDRRLR